MPPAAEPQNARSTDAPRRCFICLTDQDSSDPPGSWVDPCGCTLEAHQDCMLSWVTDCERSNKPLQCPVCKDRIQLEGPWDPVVALNDVVASKFTRASPFMLLGSVTMGVQFSLQMYGALALYCFSGREALTEFILGPEVWTHGEASRVFLNRGKRLRNALVLTNVGPALLLGQLMPWIGNKVFLSTASAYGVYQAMHEDDFFCWPPSPQLVMAIFPYIRSAYLNAWREFAFPYEVSLNRQIMGLPPLEPRQNEPAANDQPERRNGEGGVVGFLNGLIEALEADDGDDEQDNDGGAGGQVRIGGRGDDGMVLELVIEEIQDVPEEDEDEDEAEDEDGWVERAHGQAQRGGNAQLDEDEAAPRPAQEGQRVPIPVPAPVAAAPAPAPAPAVDNQPAERIEHEAPQAPPARRPGLGTILSGVSNAIVSALILPGLSFAMGELLRLALPKSWTITHSQGSAGRPGLLQQQWGRSLVGGCLYVVMKDVLRLYTKYRKVAAIGKRRVKNVDRERRRNGR